MIVIYLRHLGGDGHGWVICRKSDLGAVAFEGFPPAEYWTEDGRWRGLAPSSQDRGSEA